MIKETISNLNFLKVLDEGSHQEYYGCNQNWYTSVWQRMAGCGPTAASNLVAYLDHTRHTSDPGQNYRTKKSCLALMEEIWEYVTPTFQGVSTTKIFYEGLFSYAQSKGLNTGYCFIDVPKDRPSRPGFAEVLKFLEEALSKDAPVAFLNLCNGAEKKLDRWHWVTIIALEYTENGDHALVSILDNGEIIDIDLALWYKTTTKGGGFVYIEGKG